MSDELDNDVTPEEPAGDDDARNGPSDPNISGTETNSGTQDPDAHGENGQEASTHDDALGADVTTSSPDQLSSSAMDAQNFSKQDTEAPVGGRTDDVFLDDEPPEAKAATSEERRTARHLRAIAPQIFNVDFARSAQVQHHIDKEQLPPRSNKNAYKDPTEEYSGADGTQDYEFHPDAKHAALALARTRVVLHVHDPAGHAGFHQRLSLLQEFRKERSETLYRFASIPFSPREYLTNGRFLRYATSTITYIDLYSNTELLTEFLRPEFYVELPKRLTEQRNHLIITVPPHFAKKFNRDEVGDCLHIWDTLAASDGKQKSVKKSEERLAIRVREPAYVSTQFTAAFFEGLNFEAFETMQSSVAHAVKSLEWRPPDDADDSGKKKSGKKGKKKHDKQKATPPLSTDEIRNEIGLRYSFGEKRGYCFEDREQAAQLEKKFVTAYPSFCATALDGVISAYYNLPELPDNFVPRLSDFLSMLASRGLLKIDLPWFRSQKNWIERIGAGQRHLDRLQELVNSGVANRLPEQGAREFVFENMAAAQRANERWSDQLPNLCKGIVVSNEGKVAGTIVDTERLLLGFQATLNEIVFGVETLLGAFDLSDDELLDSLLGCLGARHSNSPLIDALAAHPVFYMYANPLRWSTVLCLHDILLRDPEEYSLFGNRVIEEHEHASAREDHARVRAGNDLIDTWTQALRYEIRRLLNRKDEATRAKAEKALSTFFADENIESNAELLAKATQLRQPFQPINVGFADPNPASPAHELCRFYEMVCRGLHALDANDAETVARQLLQPVLEGSSPKRKQRLRATAKSIYLAYLKRTTHKVDNRPDWFYDMQKQGALLLHKALAQ